MTRPCRLTETVVDGDRCPVLENAAVRVAITDPMPEHWYRVWSDDIPTGLAVSWDGTAFLGLWLWATNRAGTRRPDLVACAVEPQACEVPTLSKAAAGRAHYLSAGEHRSAWIRAALYHDSATAAGASGRTR